MCFYGEKIDIQSSTLHISDVLGNKYVYNLILEDRATGSGCKLIKNYIFLKEER